jgi:hypothetical protein
METKAVRIRQEGFRPDTIALLTGIKNIKPSKDLDWRLCYECTYIDGVIDYVPIHANQYELIK